MSAFLSKPLVLDEMLFAIREQVSLARGEPMENGRLRVVAQPGPLPEN